MLEKRTSREVLKLTLQKEYTADGTVNDSNFKKGVVQDAAASPSIPGVHLPASECGLPCLQMAHPHLESPRGQADLVSKNAPVHSKGAQFVLSHWSRTREA